MIGDDYYKKLLNELLLFVRLSGILGFYLFCDLGLF